MVWEKRGTSHLGFVLSFVIFLTFLLFMYAMIEPVLKIQPGKETLLNDVKNKIVGEFEADPLNKKLSSTSPIGSALLNKKIGDLVEIEVPDGKKKYKILDIK